MFKKAGLAAKLIAGFITVAVITGVVGVLGWWGITQTRNGLYEVAEVSLPSILLLKDTQYEYQRIQTALRTLKDPTLSRQIRELQFQYIEDARARYTKDLGEYDPIERVAEEDRLYQIFLGQLEGLRDLNNLYIETAKGLLQPGADMYAIIARLNDIEQNQGQYEAFNNLQTALDELVEYVIHYYGVEEIERIEAAANLMNVIIIVVAIIGFGLAVALGVIISRAISKPVNGITQELYSSAGSLESASSQVSSSSQELSSGASELASSVEEMTSSIEELQSIIESNTKNTNEGKGMSDVAYQQAQESSKLMNDLGDAIEEIDENSRKVAKVIKVIDDIAFQTNILALNAAVEAARAGDAGRGFAVVADQVKNLAQKSAEAAKETATLIEDALSSVVEGKHKSESVKENSIKSGEAMEKINTIMDEISRASTEQLKGANQVTKAISQINAVVQQTSSTSEENAAAGEELMAQAETLGEIVVRLNTIVKGGDAQQEIAKRNAERGRQIKKHKDAHLIAHNTSEKKQDASALRISHKDEDVEIIKPEDKIPLEDFKDF
jgi:methyl-accepting chemotaxis protein